MADLSAAYEETVRAIVASVSDVMDGAWGDRTWERIVVNYETLLHTPESTTSTIAFSIARLADHPPERVDFRLSDEAEAGLERIKDILHDDKGTYWTVCDIAIAPDGQYHFEFGYGDPYRLSGNLHDTRFDGYLARHLAETDGSSKDTGTSE